ncbi:hypothetical protein JCM9533A_00930 [Catenuloplanes niger JCM 9533]
MSTFAPFVAVALLVVFFLLVEVAAATLPLLIVVTLVPPGERRELAEVLAAADHGRRLRLWPALRAAAAARREAGRAGTDRCSGSRLVREIAGRWSIR